MTTIVNNAPMFGKVTHALLVSSVVLLLSLTYLGWRNRTEPGARLFAVLEAVSAVWAGLTLVGLTLPVGPSRIRVWGVSTGLSLVVIVLWFGFILSYTGRRDWLTSAPFGALATPLVAAGGLYFVAPRWSPLVGQIRQVSTPAGTVVRTSIGPVGLAVGLYVYLVFLAGLALVLKTVFEGGDRFTGQAIALVLGTLVTVVASALGIAGVPARGYPVTEVALTAQSLFWGYAVFRQQFLDVIPAVGRIGERAVFEDVDDGVAVLDGNGDVVRMNPRAREYFDVDDPEETSLERLLDGMGVSSLSDLPTRFHRYTRTYQAKASTMTNWRGDPIGHTLIVRDVTRLTRRQQRLQVLNRILRHNVRNDVSVALAVGERLQHRDEEELASMGERLSTRAYSLTTISEKVMEIEKALDGPRRSESVDPASVVADVVDPLSDRHPEATVTTSVAVDELRTDRRLLALALGEVVENALLHTGTAPDVDVEVTRAGESVRIAVTDDGPGIPREEVDPVLSGEETDMHHGSSIGLWLVYWAIQALGGEVEITTTPVGTKVVLTVPDGAGTATGRPRPGPS